MEGSPREMEVNVNPQHDPVVQVQPPPQQLELNTAQLTIEQLRQSLEDKYKEIDRLQKLQRKYARAKQMFRKEQWREMKRQWRRMTQELEGLVGEEKQLVEVMQGLKSTLEQVYSEEGRKLEEIQRLTRKVEELKRGKGEGKVRSQIKSKSNDKRDDKVAGVILRKEAVAILPEEMWKMIIGSVSDPNDLWNLCNTCQLFNTMLSKWKTGWLLAEALPYLYKDLPRDKLLECRLICKSWNSAVDNFLAEHVSIRPHNINQLNPHKVDYVDPMKEMELRRIKLTFCNKDNPSILEDPDVPRMIPGRNPFIGRCAILHLGEFRPSKDKRDEDIKMLLEKVTNFLRTFGKEIYYLSVWFGRSNEWAAEEELHPQIVQFATRDLFPLVPNLRELCMDYIGMEEEDIAGNFGPLPPAPNLETIQAYHPRAVCHDPVVSLTFQKYCGQLRKIFTSMEATSMIQLRTLEWPNLTELHLNFVVDSTAFLGLAQVRMPQLSKLGLNMEEIDSWTTFENVLELIRDLAAVTQLNTVRLDGGLHLLRMGGGNFSRDHQAPASIKTLEIDHNWEGKVPNYAFLLGYFPLVENVHLFLRRNYEYYEIELDLRPWDRVLEIDQLLRIRYQEPVEIVEVNKYIYKREMYRSNIWGLLHQLKVFTFQWDVYTRKGYEAYQEMEGRK